MSTIGGKNITVKSFADFLALYKSNPKPIFFWDTCGLLEIIRFIYRENNGPATLSAIMILSQKIRNNEIYCVTSELAAKEWDDNVDKILDDVRKSLQKTEDYHSLAAMTINTLLSGNVQSDPISTYHLEEIMRDIALNIAVSSHFIKYDEISTATLTRVSMKIPPAKDKDSNTKDCAFWETMLRICHDINAAIPGDNQPKVFYTVNTKDFADKSRGNTVFYSELLTEANANRFHCSFLIDDAMNNL